MYRSHRYAATLSLAAILLGSGCKRTATDDATVTAAVQTRIAGDGALGSQPIQTSVQSGIATLSGTVGSEAVRRLAAIDAAQVAGVRTVVNNLTVESAEVAAPVIAPAPAIAPTPMPAPTPVATPPRARGRTAPSKPTAAVAREKTPSPDEPAPVERPAPVSPQTIAPPAPPPAPAQPTFREMHLPAGTSIPVRMTQTLDSATTQQGETFSGTVASDVLVDGVVAIRQGSAVSGRVDAVQEAAHFKGNSLLTIELTSISHGGERVTISTEAFSKEGAGRGKNTAIKTGAGAAAGAILGGIFGGGKGAAIGAAAGGGAGAGVNGVTRGEQVQIASETLIPFKLSNPISVRVPRREGSMPAAETPTNEPQRRPLNSPE